MTDDLSTGELGRTIDRMRQDMVHGFGNLNQRMDTFVTGEVHASDLRRLDQRIDVLEKDIADLEAAKRWAIGIAVTAVGVLVAVVAVIGDLL